MINRKEGWMEGRKEGRKEGRSDVLNYGLSLFVLFVCFVCVFVPV